MPSPVYITQTQEEDQTFLLKQINDLKLNTNLPTTLTLPTLKPTPSPTPPPSTPATFISTFSSKSTTGLVLPPSKCLPDVVG